MDFACYMITMRDYRTTLLPNYHKDALNYHRDITVDGEYVTPARRLLSDAGTAYALALQFDLLKAMELYLLLAQYMDLEPGVAKRAAWVEPLQ